MAEGVSGRRRGLAASVVRRRPDQEYENDGEQGNSREGAEDDVEGHMTIAQGAEQPVAEAAAGDADEVHDAVAGGSPLRSGNLAENRHVVAVKESPAEAEQDEPEDRERQRVSVSHAEERGKEEGHSDRAGVDSASLRHAHPAVRHSAADDGAAK
jgi:hypothetical protein